jgi:TDG/mug DNA glycosylase family protein
MAKLAHVSHGFGPVYDERSRVLILGSFPSEMSREQGFYYGNPRNRFWDVLGALTGDDVPGDTAGRERFLKRHGIALYDVIENCDIAGSSDSSIRNVVPADLGQIFRAADIGYVFANGGLAKKLYDRYQAEAAGIEAVRLPSTSPANAAYSLDRLLESWSAVGEALDADKKICHGK